ncbi:hypothetical protein IJ103_00195 [Candidatus Saccharibacteria bacterium]|nr:hypothetical protein [Candidatus Saccharibacteria bacterium]
MSDNEQTQDAQELTTGDGRKIISFNAGGESYTVESTEQAARGKKAEIEAELAAIKMQAARRGVQIKKLRP